MHKEGFINNKPTVFEYSDYRQFLRELFLWFKQDKQQFSYRYFSKEAGYKSPNFLKLVIEGKRNLSEDSIEKFGSTFKLNKDEQAFFRTLVKLNQAVNSKEKIAYSQELLKSKKFNKIYPLKKHQYNYYSNWYNIVIREMVTLPNFINDNKWIAKKMSPQITEQEVSNSLEVLEKLNLIKKDDSGKITQTDSTVTTGNEITMTSVAKFHHKMIKMASESIDRFDRSEREVSSSTVTLSSEGCLKVKEMVQEFRKQVMILEKEDQKKKGRVYQLNYQLFPLTNNLDDGDDA